MLYLGTCPQGASQYKKTSIPNGWMANMVENDGGVWTRREQGISVKYSAQYKGYHKKTIGNRKFS